MAQKHKIAVLDKNRFMCGRFQGNVLLINIRVDSKSRKCEIFTRRHLMSALTEWNSKKEEIKISQFHYAKGKLATVVVQP